MVASVVTSLSGCQSYNFADSETTVGPELETVGVGNWHSEPHTVHFQVHQNGELVLKEDVELDRYSKQSDADEATFQNSLHDERGQYEILARCEDGPERTAEITDEAVCRVDIIVRKDGELGISSRRDCEYE